MRDSWIDKDEVDELVQAFSPKKGRKSSPRARRKNKAHSKKKDQEEVEEKATEEIEVEKGIDDVVGIEESDSLEISSIDLIDEYANSGESGLEETTVEETTVEETTVEETTVEETTVEETTVEETAVEETTVEETAVEETAVEETAVEETAVEETAVEWDVDEVEIVEEKVLVDERNIIIDEISNESEEVFQRRSALFLGGRETDDTREIASNAGTSEADAVKAVKALAEARDRADQGGLLRSRRESVEQEIEGETEDVDGIDKTESVETNEQQATEQEEDGVDFSFVDDVNGEDLFAEIALPPPTEETDFSEEGTIRRRMAKFAGLLQEKLQATDVMVMDGEGFPLFEEKNGDQSISIEKSGGPLRLVYNMQNIATAAALEDRVSTQISIGNGRWLCLLYSAEMSDDGPMVRAVIPRVLEGEQLQKWSNLLGAALLLA